MSIIRINRFTARDGKTRSLQDFLKSIIPDIRSSSGCEQCRLLRHRNDQQEFIVLEQWKSVEAHQASVNNIPREKIDQITPLLASPPEGHDYSIIREE